MERERKLRPRHVVIAAVAVGTCVYVGGRQFSNEFGSADKLASHCTIAEKPHTGDQYQTLMAERLLKVGPRQVESIRFYGAACFTLLGREDLLHGVDIGPQSLGPDTEKVSFDDCVAFASNKELVPPEGMRRSQIVIACHDFPNALDA